MLSADKNQPEETPWVKFAVELQFLAQGGLCYSKDAFDIERFERIREISAEMISLGNGYSVDYVKSVFCNETGFQTPKLDTRAAIFQDNKILLVEERNETWSLPGGWVDVYESIRTNTIKEVKEEAGLDVTPIKLIAVQDRKLHNQPEYAYGVTKAFVLCEVVGGEFRDNIETTNSGYFGLSELPLLAEEKNNAEQIKMCFDAYYDKNWDVVFD
jgi:ADP-ribose pyrophosphatase YjhB (NUDIX family)